MYQIIKLGKSIWMGAIHTPFRYLLIYIGLILIFAIGYWNMQGDFYAPYVKYEPAAKQDLEELRKLIQEQMTKLSFDPELHSTDGTLSLDRKWLRVSRPIMFDDGSLVADLTMGLQGARGPPFTKLKIKIDPESVRFWTRKNMVFGKRIYLSENTGRLFDDGLPEDTHSLIFKAMFRSNNVLDLLLMSEEAAETYDRIVTGYKGEPTAISNSFARMLYFSAVTITTVGFGDIVPITDRARFLVGFEALSGLLVLGFFLNGMAGRIAKGEDPKK